MAKKKSNDRHKHRAFQLRLSDIMRELLNELADENDSTPSEEARRAIRKHLQDHGKWPPKKPTD